MVFLICLILAEFVSFSYPAPKLGHILFDPLSYEAAMFVTKDVPRSQRRTTSNDALLRILRVKDEAKDTTKKPCLGYDYDDKLCKLLDDRIICGYNKNLGEPKHSETVIDIGNGCFIRGDRVECGYITGLYAKSSRPTDDDRSRKLHVTETVAQSTTKRRQSIPTTTTNSFPTTSSSTPKSAPTTITTTTTVPTTTSTPSKPTTIITTEPTKILTESTAKSIESSTAKSKFTCVDKNNSLFCYEIKDSNYFIY